MRYVLLFALSVVFSINALAYDRTTKIEGRLTDNKKTELIAATVRCYVNDSIFIKGTTTNGRGEFKLEVPQTDKVQKLVFSYLGYKELTVNIQPTTESVIRLGDIVMKQDAVQIHEVVVLGENQVRTEEKLMVYPTKEELRHAYDGYSALDVLMIPELLVNTSDNSITYMNQSVLLCINGREATADEVRDLNAKNIKRVDIYPMGMPEFPQANAVINYVMKEHDYAGTLGFNANHQLTLAEGDGRVNTQYFQGKSEFAVSLAGGYKDYSLHDKGETVTYYNFPDEMITRTTRFMPSDKKGNSLNGYVNYIYRNNTHDFYVSLRMNHKDSETDDLTNQQYSTMPALFTKQEYEHSKSLNPGLKLQYTCTLPKDQRLRIEAYGSYGNNDYNRWYEFREDETITDSYRQSTAEESYYINGKVNYTKTFKNKASLNIDLIHNYTHTDDKNTRNDNVYDVSLNKNNTRIVGTYNYRIKNRFNIQLKVAGHLSQVETGGNTVKNFFFTPSFRLSYMHKKHSINLRGQANSIETNISNRTGDEYRNNEYEITRGNPNLKDHMNYDFLFTYTWNISKRFVFMPYATFYLNTNAVYRKYEYDAERNSIIWQLYNSGTNWQQHYEMAFQYNIIPKRWYVRTGILYNFDKINVYEDVYHHAFYAMGHTVYQHKGFRARIGFLTSPESVNNQTGRIFHNSVNFDMSASYSVSNWNFFISYCNPYSAESREDIDLGIYRQMVVSRISHLYDNLGRVGFSYRFNYGKKKHKFDNTEVTDVNQSTISK